MAEGNPPEGRFPPEVLLRDNDPSNGFYTIVLTIPNMKVKTTFEGVKMIKQMQNGTEKIDIQESNLSVYVKVDDNGKTTEYKYVKILPEKINTLRSKYKLRKEEVKIILKKKDNVSWGQYSDHFMNRS